MADVLLDVQSPAATPAAGQSVLYCDTTSKKWQSKNDGGIVDTLGDLENFSTANQTGVSNFSSDSYLSGSSLAIPGSLVRAGTMYYLCFDMVKTGAGTATPILSVRFGTAGTTADAARLAFTFGVGTAVVDTGIFEIWAHWRNVGASSVLVGMCRLTHHLAATGLTTGGASGTAITLITSAAFDSTVASSIIGTSFNGGASFSGTNTVVQSKLCNV